MCDEPAIILGLHSGMALLKEAIERLEQPLDESLDKELLKNPLARPPDDWYRIVSSYNELVRTLKHRHPQWKHDFEYLVDVEGRVL